MEDDSWADALPPIVRPVPSRKRTWNDVQTTTDVDDAWADSLPTVLRRTGRAHKIPSRSEDDRWVDDQPPRATKVYIPASVFSNAPERVPLLGSADLKDDAWADTLGSRGGGNLCTSSLRLPFIAPPLTLGLVQPAPPLTGETTSRPLEQVTPAGTSPSAPSKPLESRLSLEPIPVMTSGSGTVDDQQKDHVPRWLLPPEIPLEYKSFFGRVIEAHADSTEAKEGFEKAFSRSRFESTFPDAAGLPFLVGLDFEWKPDRRPGDDHPIALIQLACWDTALLIRTTKSVELPEWLTNFLEDDSFMKVTASFDLSDKHKLKNSFGWDFDERTKVSGYIDIAELAKQRNVPYGMFKMAKSFEVPMLKAKVVGASNWARDSKLSFEQRKYAADDAFFQLFLMGKLLEHTPPEPDREREAAALKSWQITRTEMENAIRSVDNKLYHRDFFAIREIVKDAVDTLCRALGSGGYTSINSVNNYKTVTKALAATSKSFPKTVNCHFLKQNEDLFFIKYESLESQVCVRLRVSTDDDADGELEAQDEETEEHFLSRVLELLLAYKPPNGKRPTVMGRNIPEQFWVPARAILKKREIQRLESCMDHEASIETKYSEDDGILLRLARHPRAADDMEHMERCVELLQENLEIPAGEAKHRLSNDTKFMQFWAELRIIKAGSKEEASVGRTLRARVRILTDAQHVGEAVNATWEEAREALEKVKVYRRELGDSFETGSKRGERKIQAIIQ